MSKNWWTLCGKVEKILDFLRKIKFLQNNLVLLLFENTTYVKNTSHSIDRRFLGER